MNFGAIKLNGLRVLFALALLFTASRGAIGALVIAVAATGSTCERWRPTSSMRLSSSHSSAISRKAGCSAPSRRRAPDSQLAAIGVDEVACLIDFGVPASTVLASLEPLAEIVRQQAGLSVEAS